MGFKLKKTIRNRRRKILFRMPKMGCGGPIVPESDPLVQIQADLKSCQSEVSEWQDRFLRKAADLENYRKRAEKEKTDSIALAKTSVLIEFLPLWIPANGR